MTLVKGVIPGNLGGPDPISGKTLRGEMRLPGEEGILPVVSSVSPCWELHLPLQGLQYGFQPFPGNSQNCISQFLAIHLLTCISYWLHFSGWSLTSSYPTELVRVTHTSTRYLFIESLKLVICGLQRVPILFGPHLGIGRRMLKIKIN